MSRHSSLTSRRKKNQSSKTVSDRRAWWGRMVLLGVLVIAGFTSYYLAPQAMAGWTTIEHVSISGVKFMKRGEILALLALPSETSLWTIDPTTLEERIEAHPRIASAMVGRALPHTLTVVVKERVPAGVFQHAGGQLFLDHDGVVLSIAPQDATSELPVFSGLSVIRVLEGDPATRDRARLGVKVARFLQDRFDGPLQIDLGSPTEILAATEEVIFRVNEDIEQTWPQYLALEPTIQSGLTAEQYEIDLRYSDKVIVRQRG